MLLYGPGVAAAAGLGAVAALVAGAISGIPSAPVALLGGIAISAAGAAAVVMPGAQWVATRVLRLGVMLLGAQLSLAVAVSQGASSILMIGGLLVGVFTLAHLLGARLGIPYDLRMLIAAGVAICGNSAIAVVAPLVRAPRPHVAIAIGVVTLSGTIFVVLYPFVGGALGLSQAAFGTWAATGIADTGQVVAASLAYGSEATETATVTKLIRNTFIAPVALAIALVASGHSDARRPRGFALVTAVPPFVLGFVALSALRTMGAIGPELGATVGSIGTTAILIGLAGVGLATRLDTLRTGSRSTLLYGASIVAVVAGMTLLVVVLSS